MKVGRNDPCSCGSGKKYKKCCWGKNMEIKRSPIDYLSQEAKDYLNVIKGKIGKSVPLKIVNPSEIPGGFKAAFREDLTNPNNTSVLLTPNNLTGQSLAHEVTHFLLSHSGYDSLQKIKGVVISKEEFMIQNLLGTMLEDIVVNHIIQEEGFSPFDKNYPSVVKQEIKLITRAKQNPYSRELATGQVYYSKFKIFRYILAWSLMEYCELSQDLTSTLKEYLSCFENHFPEEYKECEEIMKIIENHNIFDANQYKIILEKILAMWQLNNKYKIISRN